MIFRYYNYPPEEITQLDLVNPMCEAFPRVASCTFWKYGSGGKPTGHQAICILALNIVIDKVYLILWYWYFVIAILALIRIICRCFQISSGNIRYWLMKIKMHRYVLCCLVFQISTKSFKTFHKGIDSFLHK